MGVVMGLVMGVVMVEVIPKSVPIPAGMSDNRVPSPPASSKSTRIFGFSLNLDAITAPVVPPPTII